MLRREWSFLWPTYHEDLWDWMFPSDTFKQEIDCASCTDEYSEYEILMPRFNRGDISITGEINGNSTIITINAKNDNYMKKKVFYIPFNSDHVESKLDLGVLTIKAYKKEKDKFQIELK